MCTLSFDPAKGGVTVGRKLILPRPKKSSRLFNRYIPLSHQEHISLENSFLQCPRAYALAPRHINQGLNQFYVACFNAEASRRCRSIGTDGRQLILDSMAQTCRLPAVDSMQRD